jgi:hypothetical protein
VGSRRGFFESAEHPGNVSHSTEEATRILQVVRELLDETRRVVALRAVDHRADEDLQLPGDAFIAFGAESSGQTVSPRSSTKSSRAASRQFSTSARTA